MSTMPGYQAGNCSLTCTPNMNAECDLSMVPITSVIMGSVIDDFTGMKINNAKVTCMYGTLSNTTLTSDSGFMLPRIPSGPVSCTASHPLYNSVTRQVTLQRNQSLTWDFSLTAKPSTISGSILTTLGQSVDRMFNPMIMCQTKIAGITQRYSAAVLPNSYFSLVNLPQNNYTCHCSANGWENSASRNFTTVPNSAFIFNCTITPKPAVVNLQVNTPVPQTNGVANPFTVFPVSTSTEWIILVGTNGTANRNVYFNNVTRQINPHITITVGDRVTWIAAGGVHSVTSASSTACQRDGWFDTGVWVYNASNPQRFSYVYNTTGTYYYYCTVGTHCSGQGMKAGVTVILGSTVRCTFADNTTTSMATSGGRVSINVPATFGRVNCSISAPGFFSQAISVETGPGYSEQTTVTLNRSPAAPMPINEFGAPTPRIFIPPTPTPSPILPNTPAPAPLSI